MGNNAVSDLEFEKLRHKVSFLEEEVERLRKLNSELSERTLELYSLFELSYSLGSGVRYDRMPEDSMDFLGELLGIEQFSLMLYTPEEKKLYIKAALGIPKEARQRCTITPPEGIAGYVFSTGEAVYLPDVTKDSRYLYYKGMNQQGGSLLSLPLLDEDGKPFGVLNIAKPEVNGFTPADQARYGTLALQIAVIIQNYTFYRRLQRLSLTDELTGIANRRSFFEELEEEHHRHARNRRHYCLLLVDVDFFKRYNDVHGHLEGDLALREMARILASRCRSTDHLARYGGEEFAICATRTKKDEGVKLAEALRLAVAEHTFVLSDGAPASPLSITIGVANFPDDSENYRDVLDKADKALFYGKSKGRNTVITYPMPELVAPDVVGATGDMPGRRGKASTDDEL